MEIGYRDHRRTVELDAPLSTAVIGQIVKGDANADRFVLELKNGGQPADLSEYSADGLFINRLGMEVPLRATVSGSEIVMVLTGGCYDVGGAAVGHVRLVSSDASQIRTVIRFVADVTRDGSGVAYDPDGVIGDIETLLAKLTAMENATTAGLAAAQEARNAAAEAVQTAEAAGEQAVSLAQAAGVQAIANANTAGAEAKATAETAAAKADAAREAIEGDLSSLKDTTDKLSDEIMLLLENAEKSGERVPLTMVGAKKINSTGVIVDVTDGNANYQVSEPVTVTPGDRLLVTCAMNYKGALYALYDAEGTALVIKLADSGGEYTTVENEYIIVPENASMMRVCTYAAVKTATLQVNVKSTFVAKKLADKVVTYNALDDKLSAAFAPSGYADVALEYTLQNHMLGKSGAILEYTGIHCTDYIDCTSMGEVWVTGEGWANAVVLGIYDEQKNVIATYRQDQTAIDEIVKLPKNARYIVVCDTSEITGRAKPIIKIPTIYVPVNRKKWEGKKWVVVGDSLTAVNQRTTMHYHDYVAENTGIAVVNMGVGGTGYASGAANNKAFYQRVADVPTDADVVTIFGSGNDLSTGLEIGTATDTGTATLCGCINTTLDNLIAIMPTVSLGIVSPTPWVGSDPSNVSGNMARYSAALKIICEYRSIPFLDLYHCSNLRPWTEEGRLACYTKDDGNGVHPDETGHKLIAARFKAFLETLIL